MANISVFSEIGKLEAVAVHSPGPEVDVMTPSLMHELLFDDILFGREARVEHDIFRKVMSRVAKVLDVQDLLAEALKRPQAKQHFVQNLTALHKLDARHREQLAAMDEHKLAEKAISGWREDIDEGRDYFFSIPPVPNLLFMRDPAAIIGNCVSVNNMATSARRPEPFILETIMRFHPEYHVEQEENFIFNAIPSFLKGQPQTHHTIEGGDILVLSDKVIAVGVSIRTTQSAVTMMAEKLRQVHEFQTLLAVLIPHERSAMHLDTIFTRIDEEHCLIFPPYFSKQHPNVLPTVKMDLTGDQVGMVLKDNFLAALADEGIDLKPIDCGGKNLLDQEREQWTDGANSFCLAPGVILGYDRNIKTAQELSDIGYNVVKAEEVLEQDIDLLDGKRYLIMIKGNELSRARGGPRCMTMPLRRSN